MTQAQIKTVRSTWKILSSVNPLLVGELFYTQLFYTYPHLKPLFSISKELQALKLMKMLNTIIEQLDHLDQLKPDLQQLGRRHTGYGVKPVHYLAVGEVLFWTIRQGLGREWNEEVRQAWEDCYQEIAAMMLTGAERG